MGADLMKLTIQIRNDHMSDRPNTQKQKLTANSVVAVFPYGASLIVYGGNCEAIFFAAANGVNDNDIFRLNEPLFFTSFSCQAKGKRKINGK